MITQPDQLQREINECIRNGIVLCFHFIFLARINIHLDVTEVRPCFGLPPCGRHDQLDGFHPELKTRKGNKTIVSSHLHSIPNETDFF
jgi:hypothetical protein